MQRWEDVEDVEALRDTAAKLGVENSSNMDRQQLIEALNTAAVSDTSPEEDSQARADAESAFGDASSSS
jgi:hypothetical protein